jgi:uncharacterized protein with von Willebrand factor type A (vWA) domain
MLLNFLDELRAAGIPASVKEHLVLLEALEPGRDRSHARELLLSRPRDLCEGRGAARPVRSGFLKGLQGYILRITGNVAGDIPEDWLRAVAERNFSRPKKWRRSSRWETGTRSWRR